MKPLTTHGQHHRGILLRTADVDKLRTEAVALHGLPGTGVLQPACVAAIDEMAGLVFS